jgi:hypothetical protein
MSKVLSHTKPNSEYSNSAERNVQREGDTDGNTDHRKFMWYLDQV